MKTITKFIYPAFAALAVACVALSPVAQALNPPPDGGYANGTTAEGTQSLFSLTTGIWNTALGFQALNHATAGNQNTATGVRALTNGTNGGFNTATGVYSLFSNTIGFFNSATGAYSLVNNTTGGNNTANGYGALYYNTVGQQNTATGFAALYRTQRRASTRPPAFKRCLATPAMAATTTWLLAIKHSLPTQPAAGM